LLNGFDRDRFIASAAIGSFSSADRQWIIGRARVDRKPCLFALGGGDGGCRLFAKRKANHRWRIILRIVSLHLFRNKFRTQKTFASQIRAD
jgi:hypothetical protein